MKYGQDRDIYYIEIRGANSGIATETASASTGEGEGEEARLVTSGSLAR